MRRFVGDLTWRRGLALAGILVGLLALVVLATALFPSPESLREDLRDLGALGLLVVVTLALVHVVLPYPAELLCLAAGFAYGFAGGLAILMVAWLASGLTAYWVGARLGRAVVGRLASERALETAERFAATSGATGLLALRLIPLVPFNAVCFACGIGRVPLWRYCWTTVLGFTPLLALVAYLGSRAEDFDLTDPRVWGSTLAFLAVAVAAHFIARRAHRA